MLELYSFLWPRDLLIIFLTDILFLAVVDVIYGWKQSFMMKRIIGIVIIMIALIGLFLINCKSSFLFMLIGLIIILLIGYIIIIKNNRYQMCFLVYSIACFILLILHNNLIADHFFNNNDIKTLIISIWGIHTTLAILSITIFALSTNFNDKGKYGIKYKELRFVKSTRYQVIQIVCYSFIMLLTQLVWLFTEMISVSLYVLVVNTIIIAKLIYDNLRFLSNEDEINRKIAESYIHNAEAYASSNDIKRINNTQFTINTLCTDIEYNFYNNKIIEIMDEVELLSDILVVVLQNKKNDLVSDHVMKYLMQVFRVLSKKDGHEYIFIFFFSICGKMNNKKMTIDSRMNLFIDEIKNVIIEKKLLLGEERYRYLNYYKQLLSEDNRITSYIVNRINDVVFETIIRNLIIYNDKTSLIDIVYMLLGINTSIAVETLILIEIMLLREDKENNIGQGLIIEFNRAFTHTVVNVDEYEKLIILRIINAMLYPHKVIGLGKMFINIFSYKVNEFINQINTKQFLQNFLVSYTLRGLNDEYMIYEIEISGFLALWYINFYENHDIDLFNMLHESFKFTFYDNYVYEFHKYFSISYHNYKYILFWLNITTEITKNEYEVKYNDLIIKELSKRTNDRKALIHIALLNSRNEELNKS